MPDLSIVVVSWNTCELLRDCLRSIYDETSGIELEVFVVDNASSDGSVAMVREAFPAVKLIELGENVGFARANNLAFQQCTAPVIVLFNSDATVQRNAFQILLTFLSQHPDAAAVGPKLIHPRLQLDVLGCGGQPTLRRVFNHYFFLARLFPRFRFFEGLHCYIGVHDHEPRTVGWLAGTCLMVRREVIEEVGPLSEAWFMYAEDVEWSARMLAAGYQLYHVPAAVVEHHAGASAAQHAQGTVLPMSASRELFIKMNQPSAFTLLLHDAIRVCGLGSRALGYFLRSLSRRDEAKMWSSKAATFVSYTRAAAGLPRRARR